MTKATMDKNLQQYAHFCIKALASHGGLVTG